MTYSSWKQLPLGEKNARCAKATGWTANDCGTAWYIGDEEVWRADLWSPCTDRNHTARMVEEVGRRSPETVVAFARALASSGTEYTEGASVAWCAARWFSLLVADPDLLAWACCEALLGKEADDGKR